MLAKHLIYRTFRRVHFNADLMRLINYKFLSHFSIRWSICKSLPCKFTRHFPSRPSADSIASSRKLIWTRMQWKLPYLDCWFSCSWLSFFKKSLITVCVIIGLKKISHFLAELCTLKDRRDQKRSLFLGQPTISGFMSNLPRVTELPRSWESWLTIRLFSWIIHFVRNCSDLLSFSLKIL